MGLCKLSQQAVDEITASKSFISNGYVLCDVDDVDGLQKIQNHIAQSAAAILGLPCVSPLKFLNTIHDQISQARLNEFRVQVINSINLEDWMRPTYYRVARPMLDALVGNEIAMQLRLNLSIQLPGDDSSLLPMHADVWSGDSPFEVVAWLPLVDCFGTKSMYILPPAAADALNNSGFEDRIKGKKDLFDAIILSCAGMKSLKVEDKITEIFSTQELIPSAGQGIIALQCRKNDNEIISILDKINHKETSLRAYAERNVLKVLEGDCETAIGVHAIIERDIIILEAELFSLDGLKRFYEKKSSKINNVKELGIEVGELLKKKSNNSYKR